MASPPIPPLLDYLATRRFSFYPPILHVERNEWLYRKGTWSEILVVNCKSGEEIWIPRGFLGEVSCFDDPVLIVGLTRKLEYSEGVVRPCQRRVIEMPMAVGEGRRTAARPERPRIAPIVDIRVTHSIRSRAFRFVGAVLAAATLLSVVALRVTHWRVDSPPPGPFPQRPSLPRIGSAR